MTPIRIALANIRIAATPDQSVDLVGTAIAEAARQDVQVICFPECYVPGYRWRETNLPSPNPPSFDQTERFFVISLMAWRDC